jgi:hypothetical protein
MEIAFFIKSLLSEWLKTNRCVFIEGKKICLFVFNLWAVVTGFEFKNQ